MPQHDTTAVAETVAQSPAPRRERDPRIDAFRGAALVTIFVDHVPGNPYELFTLRNWGFSDAAEAFFIMSGIAAGLAYSGAFRTKPFLEAAAPIWKRSWTLYVVHIFLTLVGVALFAAGAATLALAGAAQAQNWPQADWQSQPRVESAALAELEQYAFAERDDVERTGVRTDALLVIRDGQIVYERYAEPTTVQTAHLSWSMAKSLLAST